jgi:D-alanyl-D-alanine carboxypeptidase
VREFNGIPRIDHGGEVSGFLSSNYVFPTRNGAVVVLSNQDGMNLVSPLADAISRMLFLPAQSVDGDTDVARVKGVVEGLRKGHIDSALFTDNAKFYFTATALGDIQKSLAPLGALKSVTMTNQTSRGGMTFRLYRAEFDKRALTLSLYVMPDGKIEQFMVEGN